MARAVAVFAALAVLAAAQAAAPLAPYQTIAVTEGAENVFSVPGYDADGDSLSVTITSLPEQGTLYQLSQVYSDFGFEPKLGTAVSAGDVISGSGSRIIYVPPDMHKPLGEWAHFWYTTHDGSSASRLPGKVSLVGADRVLVGSEFTHDAEGWTVVNNGAKGGNSVFHDATSRGALNRFIYGVEDEILSDAGTGDDHTLWYFVAPPKFLGDHALSYGGSLDLTISSASGDFSADNLNAPLPLVILDCDSCANHAGVSLAFNTSSIPAFTGATTSLSLPLHESAGWVTDPKNTLLEWKPPTQCELAEVLQGLTRVRVLGDHTKWYESLSLDNVYLRHGSAIPIPCYSSF